MENFNPIALGMMSFVVMIEPQMFSGVFMVLLWFSICCFTVGAALTTYCLVRVIVKSRAGEPTDFGIKILSLLSASMLMFPFVKTYDVFSPLFEDPEWIVLVQAMLGLSFALRAFVLVTRADH